MHDHELIPAIIIVVAAIIFSGLMSWYSGNIRGQGQALKEALPVCHHGTVGHSYGNYTCSGEYSYKRMKSD